MNVQPMTHRFLQLARPEIREEYAVLLDRAESGWAKAQQAFLDVSDRYIEKELAKPVDGNIHEHEAGGEWRIAFPHLQVRSDERLTERLANLMKSRKTWTDTNFYHGFPDSAEVHHEIETFIYFQLPLFYARLPGWKTALASIEDVAHHIGNWVDGVPDWYNQERREFVSAWLGTRKVRDFPPFDYQEANHFRFVDVGVAAYLGTGEQRYLDLAEDYASRWCDHIESLHKSGKPIRCSILPDGVIAEEMNCSGAENKQATSYEVFYSEVADNTAYDIASGLLDIYRITRKERYLEASEMVFDQFVQHSTDGRPAELLKEGVWKSRHQSSRNPNSITAWMTSCTFLARYAVRHDVLTGQDRYREPILQWANAIDEERNQTDQMMANVLVAGHFYTGNTDWLARAYAMGIRAAAVTEHHDDYHQCGWNNNRQGIRFLMEFLYQPIVGGPEWGTRGSIPVQMLSHETSNRAGLPDDISFRCWRGDGATLNTESVNLGGQSKEWHITQASPGVRGNGSPGKGTVTLSVAPAEKRTDTLSIDPDLLIPLPKVNIDSMRKM